MTTDELKPCPFCGGKAALCDTSGNIPSPREIMWSVYCVKSFCRGHIRYAEFPSKAIAIKAWNTRETEQELRAVIAEMAEALSQVEYRAEYIHDALEAPAKKNPVCASLRTWSGGIIWESEQALANAKPYIEGK